jgi:hypothetical protein
MIAKAGEFEIRLTKTKRKWIEKSKRNTGTEKEY